jgi:hypothetical protein
MRKDILLIAVLVLIVLVLSFILLPFIKEVTGFAIGEVNKESVPEPTSSGKGESSKFGEKTPENPKESPKNEIINETLPELIPNETIPQLLIVDVNGNEVNADIQLKQITELTFGIPEDNITTAEVPVVLYEAQIYPQDSPINEIDIHGLELVDGSFGTLKIDNTPEQSDSVETYAIDPTDITFANATVIIDAAKGNMLYKCKDWNFETRACDGEWSKLMDIIPGEDYTFVLTPEDPGYAETVYIPNATHKAYFFQDTVIPSTHIPGYGTEYTAAQYAVVNSSDDTRANFSATKGNHEVAQYKFILGENYSTIQNFTVTWEGYSTLTTSGTGVSLYLRNFTDSSWKLVTNTTSSTEQTLQYSTSNKQDFINSTSNELWLMVESVGGGLLLVEEPVEAIPVGVESSKTMHVDFVNTNVTYETIYAVETNIKDANNQTIEATVEFRNAGTNELKYSDNISKEEIDMAEPTPINLDIVGGKYDVIVTPLKNVINEIEFKDVTINQNITEFVKIDNPTDNQGYEELYAIDPTAINFTNATVTIDNAIGNELYKCKGWDFNARNCPDICRNETDEETNETYQICDSGWTLLQNITPGEQYTFTLTLEDPAYAEYNFSTYNGTTIAGQKAYASANATAKFPASGPAVPHEAEFTGTQYQGINASDTNRANTSATALYRAHRFLFNITQDVSAITQINISWYGYDTRNNVAGREVNLSVWNFTSGSWGPSLASGISTSDQWLNVSLNSGFSNYINSTGAFTFLVESVNSGGGANTLYTNYVLLKVKYAYPNVTLVSPADGNVTTINSTNFTCNASDDLALKNITLYWNYSGSWQANGTTTVTGTSNSTTFALTNLNNSIILWNCRACNNWSYCNFSSSNWTVTINYTAPDTTAPNWSNNQSSIQAIYSPSTASQFNITWIDNVAVNTVLFESNYSGTPTNYTMTNATYGGSVYNYSAILPAGTYYWKSYANDTSGNRNVSSNWTFTIAKADPSSSLVLYLQSALNNATITYGTQSNATGISSVSQDLTFNLYRNGSSVASGSPATELATLGAGYYVYVYNTTGGTNYTSGSTISRYLTINAANDFVNLTLNSAQNNVTITYGANLNASSASTSGTDQIYRNGTNVTSEKNTNVVLGAGYYQYKANTTGTTNYTTNGTGVTYYVTVNQVTPTCALSFNPASPITYGTQLNVSCSCTNGTVAQLYRNGTNITTEINTNVTLSAGTYNYTCNTTGNTNYTSAANSSNYLVNKAATLTHLFLNGTEGNKNYNTSAAANFTVTVNASGKTVYLDTNISGWVQQSGTTPLTNITVLTTDGYYNITGSFQGDTNYTASSVTYYASVSTPDTTLPSVTINAPSNNSVDPDGSVLFNCSATDNIALANISLYINGVLNQTITISGTNNTTTFTKSMANNIYTWYCSANDSSANSKDSATYNLTVNTSTVPSYTSFTGNTTNWSAVPDITNICNGTAIIDNPTKAQIKWFNCVNASYQNFDVNINLSNNFVSITFGLNPTFNSSAELTIRNLNWSGTDDFDILINGQVCPNTTCMNTTYDNNTGILVFNVTHFTNFSTSGTSTLVIWDQNDTGMPRGDRTACVGDQIDFFANYSRSQGGGTPNTGANCIINYTDSTGNSMTYNATSTYYEYNRTFSSTGLKSYNVSCEKTTSPTRPYIMVIDNITIVDCYAPKWFNQSQNASLINQGDAVKLSAYWTDDVALNTAILATNETGAWANKTANYSSPMLISGTGNWSNFTWNNASVASGTLVGWRIYANDTSGNWNVTGILAFNVTVIDNPPNTTLVSPFDGTLTTIQNISFICNATDDKNLANITFYWNYSGTWQSNGTTSISGQANNTTFLRTNLSDGSIRWNCQACDNASQCSFATSNWTVTVNTTPQNITVQSPLNITYNTTSIWFNVSTTTNQYWCKFSLDSASNITMNNDSKAHWYYSNNSMTQGAHNVLFYCNDTLGNLNSSSTVYFGIDTIAPTSNSLIDKTVDVAALSKINWTLQDNYAPGYYRVLRNGSSYIGWTAWTNNTDLNVDINSYVEGYWNYTIYFNDSASNVGTPDTVFITIAEQTPPSCANISDNQNQPSLTTIIVNGDVSDWDGILTNSKNYVVDGISGGVNGDLDATQSAARDVVLFAYTWNDTNIFFYFKRVFSGANENSMIVYIDKDNDGYMNSTDKVIIFTWTGSNGRYDYKLAGYVPSGTADLLTGDGSTMPGSINNTTTIQSNVLGGAANGIELETKISWSNLGVSPNASLTYRAATARGAGTNLPSSVEDNLNKTYASYQAMLFTPSRTGAGVNGSYVVYKHYVMNCGITNDTFDFSKTSTQSWNSTLLRTNGTAFTDTNSNGYNDTGNIQPNNYLTVLANVSIPASASYGASDTTTITATSSVNNSLNEKVNDTTAIGLIALLPDIINRITNNTLISYNFTIYNLQSVNDVIEVNSTSNQGWNRTAYYSNGTQLADTDADGNVDIGSLLASNSLNIVLSIFIPPTATIGTTDTTNVTINSSISPSVIDYAIANTTIAKRLELTPNHTDATGVGYFIFYNHYISNNWNDTDSFNLSYYSSKGWTVKFYDTDKITQINNTGSILPYGAQNKTIYVKVIVPANATEGSYDEIIIYANSTSSPSSYAFVIDNTTAEKMVTYENPAYTVPRTIFDVSETVYAKAFGLAENNVYFIWIDPNGTLVKNTTSIPVAGDGTATNYYSGLNSSSLLGNYTIVLYDAQNDNEITRIIFEVKDLQPPKYFNVSSNASEINQTDSVLLYAYWTDNKALNYTILSTNETGTWVNYTVSELTGTGNWSNYTWSNTSFIGTLGWIIWANDTSGNLNVTGITALKVKDSIPPKWANNQSSYPSTYTAAQLSVFNITWWDNINVSTVWFESNYSGSSQNYSMRIIAGNTVNGTWSYNSTLGAGTYYWKSYANDTTNNWNSTNTWVFTIAKADNPVTLLLNGTAANLTVAYGQATNASAYSTAGTVNLYRNGTSISSPDIQVLGNGTYIYFANATGNANYSDNSTGINYNLTVIDYYPNITFISQSPADVSSENLFGSAGLNITYNVTDTDASGLNSSTILLYYKVNSSSSDCFDYVNGSYVSCGYVTRDYTLNSGDSYLYRLFDNQIYPATYNLPERDLELTPHSTYSLSGNNSFIKEKFFNVSNAKEYSFFEFMAQNQSASSPILRVYYCNSSYTSGSPATSGYCTQFYSLVAGTPYDHTHSAYSSHFVAPFAANTTTGKVDNIYITSQSYFAFETDSSPSNGWDINYVTNISRTDAVQTSIDYGATWLNFTGTLDAHLHQFSGSDMLYYYVCANDTLDNKNCSVVRTDLIDLAGLPPTAPDVYSPTEGYYKGIININYTAAVSPNDYPISYYNLSLVYPNGTFVQTINSNNSMNLSYIWNSVSANDGKYLVRVQACDNLSQCSYGYSEKFTIDNTAPQYNNNITAPASPVIYAPGASYQFNITWTDATTSVNTTIFEFDGINYTPTANGNEYYVTLTDLAANESGHNYRWYANDSLDNWNSTSQMTYIVNKVPTLTALYLNGTRANMTYDVADYANFTVMLNVSGKTVYLTTDIPSWVLQSSVTPLINITRLTTSGVFNITGYFPGDDNYTSSTETWFVNVSDQTKPTITSVTATSPINQTQTTNITAVLTDNGVVGGGIVQITYPNSTSTNYTMTQDGGNTWYLEFSNTYQRGIFNYTIYANDTSGNWNSSTGYNFVVNDVTAPLIENVRPVNGTTYNYSSTVTIFANVTDLYWPSVDTVLANLTWDSTSQTINMTFNGTHYITNFTNTTFYGVYHFKIIANDTDSNTNYSFHYFVVLNNIPNITYVNVTPDTAYTNDNLDLNVTCNDQENSSLITYWNWYNNSAPVSSGLFTVPNNTNTLINTVLSGNTTKGENWSAQVICSDGFNNSTARTDYIVIQNSIPTAPTNVTITPPSVYTDTTVTCNASGSTDTDNDAITYLYKFNDTAGILQDWSTNATFSCNIAGCDRGDTLYCYALASTVDANSTINSNSTTILNSLPEATSVQLLPNNPLITDNLTCNYTYTDKDTDAESGTTFRWFKDNVLQAGLISQIVLDGNTTNGEFWKCEVTPNDGTANGTAINSTAVEIGSTAPNIVNITDNSNSTNPTNVGNNVTFTLYWSDPDAPENVRVYICNTSNINETGCQDRTFCSTSDSATNPQVCNYTTLQSDNTTMTYYAIVCDDSNKCSGVAGPSTFDVNHAPNLTTVPNITPATAYTNTVLTCNNGNFYDEDSDSEGTHTYRWFDIGVLIVGQTAQTLDCGAVAGCDKGDSIICEQTPVDQHNLAGVPRNSSARLISNSPPELNVTEPDGTNDTVTAAFNVTWNATDNDTDILTISCYADADNLGFDVVYTCFTGIANDGNEICNVASWTTGNYYIWCNATDGTAYVTDYSPGNLTVDHTGPSIGIPIAIPDPANQTQTTNITVNITDPANVSSATIEITYPNSTVINFSMIHDSGNLWYYEFSDTYQPGTYYYNIYANDTLDNWNSVGPYSFTVNDVTPPNVTDTGPAAGTGYNQSQIVNIFTNVTDMFWDSIDAVLANISYDSTYNLINLVSNGTHYVGNFANTTLVGIYNVTIIANDTSGNVNTTETTYFNVSDVTPPTIITTNPTNGTTLPTSTTIVTIQLTTDERAVCRYNTTNTDWSNMTQMPVTNSTNHNLTINTTDGQNYNYYFICEDNYGNMMNASYYLTFGVATPTAPPTGGGAPGMGVPPSANITCGDGICSPSELCSTCPDDCGTCPGVPELPKGIELFEIVNGTEKQIGEIDVDILKLKEVTYVVKNKGTEPLENVTLNMIFPEEILIPDEIHRGTPIGWNLKDIIGWELLGKIEEPRLMKWPSGETFVADVLMPGQEKEVTIKALPPITGIKEAELIIQVLSNNKIIAEEKAKLKVNSPKSIVAADYQKGDNTTDLYIMVDNRGNGELKDAYIEFNLNDGKTTKIFELYGPYDISQDNLFVIANKYGLSNEIGGKNYNLTIKVYSKLTGITGSSSIFDLTEREPALNIPIWESIIGAFIQ